MPEPKPLKKGDRCPNCGGVLEAAPTMTAEQHEKAYDRENPTSMPSHYDTAHPDVRAEIGDLYRCARCGYQTRFKADAGSRGRGDQPPRGQQRLEPGDEPGDEPSDEPARGEPGDQAARGSARSSSRRT